MSGTRRYRKLSAETLGTLLRLISEDELTPKQIAERAGVSRQQVYEYRTKLKNHEQTAPLTDMSTLVIHQRVVFRPDSSFDCSRCGQSMSRDWFTIEGNRIKPDFRYCPGCAGVATPYRDDAISPDVRGGRR